MAPAISRRPVQPTDFDRSGKREISSCLSKEEHSELIAHLWKCTNGSPRKMDYHFFNLRESESYYGIVAIKEVSESGKPIDPIEAWVEGIVCYFPYGTLKRFRDQVFPTLIPRPAKAEFDPWSDIDVQLLAIPICFESGYLPEREGGTSCHVLTSITPTAFGSRQLLQLSAVEKKKAVDLRLIGHYNARCLMSQKLITWEPEWNPNSPSEKESSTPSRTRESTSYLKWPD